MRHTQPKPSIPKARNHGRMATVNSSSGTRQQTWGRWDEVLQGNEGGVVGYRPPYVSTQLSCQEAEYPLNWGQPDDSVNKQNGTGITTPCLCP